MKHEMAIPMLTCGQAAAEIEYGEKNTDG